MNKNLILWCIALIVIIVSYVLAEVKVPLETIVYLSNEDPIKTGRMTIEDAQNFYHNSDIIGYLNIPGTSIHFFFTQTSDNTFYLNKDLYKKDSKLGTIFMDYRNTLNDKQINLYGHNGNIESAPFYELSKYKKKEFYEKNPFIEVSLPKGEKRNYQIVSVMVTKENRHMDFKDIDPSFFTENALYSEEEIQKSDSLLLLQTCSYEDKNTYLLLVAKERKRENL